MGLVDLKEEEISTSSVLPCALHHVIVHEESSHQIPRCWNQALGLPKLQNHVL
jgi:hypothetical protein